MVTINTYTLINKGLDNQSANPTWYIPPGKKKHLNALLTLNNRQIAARICRETLRHTGSGNPQALYGWWQKTLAAFKMKGRGIVDLGTGMHLSGDKDRFSWVFALTSQNCGLIPLIHQSFLTQLSEVLTTQLGNSFCLEISIRMDP